jgi:hypothetical protein
MLVLLAAVMLLLLGRLGLHGLARGRSGLFGGGEARLSEGGAGDGKGECKESGFHVSCSMFASRRGIDRTSPVNPP